MVKNINARYLFAVFFVACLLAALILTTQTSPNIATTTHEIEPVVADELKPDLIAANSPSQSVLENLINQEWPEEDLYIEKQSTPILSREQFTQAATTTKTNGFAETFKKTYPSPIDEQGRHIVLNNHRAFKVSIEDLNGNAIIFLHYPKLTSSMEPPVVRVIPIKENSVPPGHGSNTLAPAQINNNVITAEEGIELPVNILTGQGNYLIQVDPVHNLATAPKRFFITLEISK